jgi:putative two-component system response regulator
VGIWPRNWRKNWVWKTERVELIQLAAPLHDVGKIGISDTILLKPGRLTPEESTS